MTSTLVLALISALLGGGGVSGMMQWRIARRQADLDGMKLFYQAWRTEFKRMHAEIDELRLMVEALSDEIVRLGGDPLKIRAAVDDPPV